jgi:RNA polymerase sigma-70 factor (ECF subfamily)
MPASIWPDSDETRRLLQGADKGDPVAVGRLLDRHRAALRRMVAARLDRELAGRVDPSDVVQNVLVEAHRRLPEYLRDPRLPFQSWLRALARDDVIDMHRRHRRASCRSVDREEWMGHPACADHSSFDLVARLRDPQLTPAAAMLRRELEGRFAAAIEQLNEEDREMVLMRHFEFMGNGEVAQALGISPAAAGMRHLRALRRLRALLGDDPSRGAEHDQRPH